MVHRFMDNSADESQIGTLTGLLVRYFSAQCGQRHALHLLHIGWVSRTMSIGISATGTVPLLGGVIMQSALGLLARDAITNLL